ncbi:hypothetical protein Hanom_Chr00s053994g01781651 [Helianthus anomalus]
MAVAVSAMVGVSILFRLGFGPVLSESSPGSVTVRRRLTRLVRYTFFTLYRSYSFVFVCLIR